MSAATADPSSSRPGQGLGRAAGFATGLVPIVVLGFQYGGFFPDVVASYTVVVWLVLFLGISSGFLETPRPNGAGWAALAASVVLAGWGALSLGWSLSPERGLTEVVRTIAVAGTLILALSVVAAGHARHLLGGVLAGLTTITAAAVLARLLPDLLPQAWETSGVVTTRLSWPLRYWNALGAAAAMAIALAPAVAARARSPWTSGVATAAIPVSVLALALTLSRGGIVAAIVGVALGGLLVRPRLVVLRTLLVPATASAILIAVVWSRDAIPGAVGGAAGQGAGAPVVPLLALATLGTAMVQAVLHRLDHRGLLPRLPRPSRRTALGLGVVLAVVVLSIFALADGPSRVGGAWSDFKDTPLVETGSATSRLTGTGGSGRYDVWSGAWDAALEHPVKGLGLGSWENWWTPRRTTDVFVRNAHSAPFELFAETGIIGLAALLALLAAPLAGGVIVLRRRRIPGSQAKRGRDAMAAIPLAGAFAVAVAIDWNWQLSVLPVATFLATAPLLARRERAGAASSRARARMATSPDGAADATPGAHRRGIAGAGTPLVLTALTLAAVIASTLAMVAPDGVQRSSRAVRENRLADAAAEARSTADAAPFALTPALQEAAILERAGRLDQAAAAARRATAREPQNWRPWLVRARIDAARGHRRSALSSIGRVRKLNPRSPIFLGAGAEQR